MIDTIFALSSGAPPAAIAVIRISGPQSSDAIRTLAGRLPAPRKASLCRLVDTAGNALDSALVLWLPGPNNATGEDCAELHLHGGRAVVSAVEQALAALPGLRKAEPGEFTRRAFANGRIDLAEAEGLADLLSAETELQRRAAMAMAEGVLSQHVADWRGRLLALAAALEADLDFSDEDDVASLPADFSVKCDTLAGELDQWLNRPRAEPLREGFRVVLAGPPNAGKSTLFNALVEKEAAITAAEPGTTRDVLTQSVGMDGVPFTFVDTAGLRSEGAGEIEKIGIARAEAEASRADLVLWLGPEGTGPSDVSLWEIEAQCDRADAIKKSSPRHRISVHSGVGLTDLRSDLIHHARASLPKPGDAALNERQFRFLSECASALYGAGRHSDPLLAAEELRIARSALDRLLGNAGVEDMLDALFGRFCIGK